MNPPKAPKNKAEAAFAGLCEPYGADPEHSLYGLHFYPSQSNLKKQLPCVVFFIEEAQEITPESRVYEGGMFCYLLSQKDDDTPMMHDARLSALQDLLSDSAAVRSALNYSGGDDSRPVTNFHLFGYFESKCKDDQKERQFGEALFYELTFAGFDKR